MKKNIIISILIFLSIIVNAQKKTIAISQKKTGSINCIYNKIINLETSDTTFYINLSFQNKKYDVIEDIYYISFLLPYHNSKVLEFVKDLEAALHENKIDDKANITWKKEDYMISIGGREITIISLKKRGLDISGWTSLSQAECENLINWFKSIGF